MEKKKCFKCGEVKGLDQFYVHKEMGDGHLNKCKTCAKRDSRERYNDPVAHERIRAYERQRFQDPERKAKVLEYARRRDKRRPGKRRARGAVAYAIRIGQLERKPCEVCKAPKAQAHHTDYRKPLAVKWLCFKHHRAEHGQKHIHGNTQ